MLLFHFASFLVFLSLRDVSKKVFFVNQNGGQAPPGPQSNGTEFA